MKSYSQAGQDKFVRAVCRPGRLFLDVGCHDGETNSNSLALEEDGWEGICFDIQHFPWKRKAKFVQGDVTSLNLVEEIAASNLRTTRSPWLFDYLSLDVDESTTNALRNILSTPFIFGCITIEHDLYRLGPGPRDEQRQLLSSHGYKLVCGDVVVEPGPGVPTGGPYEDWWINPEAGDLELAKQYACNGKIGRLIVPD